MQQSLNFRFQGLEEMRAEIETMATRAVPYAARETLNGMAFAGRSIWQEQMKASFTLRNRFTQQRALVERATGHQLDSMRAVLGHTEDYMRRLEQGIGEHAKREGVPIPTEAAAGQAEKTLRSGRKAPVRRAFVIRALGKIRRQPGSLSSKARNARAIRQAIKDGSRLAYLEVGRRRGIFRVMGGARKPNIRKLYDLTRPFVPLPRVPTLSRTLDKVSIEAPSLGLAALQRQLERQRAGSRNIIIQKL